MSKNDTFEVEQLTDAAYYILLALLKQRHGYAIMNDIETISEGEMIIGAATMYTLLKKMVKNEYIEQVATTDRTKQYTICEKGLQILKREIARRERMVLDGKRMYQESGYHNI